MTSITDFILARVAEDEKEARAMNEDLRNYPPSTYEMAQVPMLDMGVPERVLAECDAKRKIVALLEAWDQDPEPYSPDYWAAPMWAVVYALAAIWSDHADYEQTWANEGKR